MYYTLDYNQYLALALAQKTIASNCPITRYPYNPSYVLALEIVEPSQLILRLHDQDNSLISLIYIS